ncbi:MAG: hypothetical protein QOG42_1237 [Solirubrobacteraceae bacterium]|jgi:hypothetical protein|nr:hypothetical protein [Solirubrobacteraceae bacterium]
MSPDSKDESSRDIQQAMAGEADRMEARLGELDEHIDDAKKKADEGRPEGEPASGDPLDDVAGGGTDHDEHVDDPEGPIVGPE